MVQSESVLTWNLVLFETNVLGLVLFETNVSRLDLLYLLSESVAISFLPPKRIWHCRDMKGMKT